MINYRTETKALVKILILLLFSQALQTLANCPEAKEIIFEDNRAVAPIEWLDSGLPRLGVYSERYAPTTPPLENNRATKLTKVIIRGDAVHCCYALLDGMTQVMMQRRNGIIQEEDKWQSIRSPKKDCWSCHPINFLPSDCPFTFETEKDATREETPQLSIKKANVSKSEKSSATNSATSTPATTPIWKKIKRSFGLGKR